MNANDLTFGVEFETTMPQGTVNVGSYSNPNGVEWLPQGWKVKPDGSIRAGAGRQGAEFVSPVLRGADGLAQVVAVIKMIAERGGKVNRSTGMHVHVGGFEFSTTNLARLTTLVANVEKAIYASTGTKSRENGTYCRSTAEYGSASAAINAGYDRFRVLNLTNVANDLKKTVEFRAFAGTLNVVKAVGHILMCLALVERATEAKRTGEWAHKPIKETSPVHRNGVGQTELTRLFYQIGWTKGRTNHVYGNVARPNGTPDLKTIKRELMRLAKEYDRGGSDETEND